MRLDERPPMYNCDVCGERAAIHATDFISGTPREMHLCEKHASDGTNWAPASSPQIAAPHLYWAASYLRNLFSAQHVPAMIRALDEPDANIRYFAAFVLGRIGRDAREALSALSAKLEDDDNAVRSVASWAINSIRSTEIGSR